MADIKYNSVEDGELFKFDKVGAKIQGILQSYKTQKTAKGEGHVYEVKTKNGIVAFFAPSMLQKKLETIAIGKIVSIEFTEVTRTNNGNDLKKFSVGFADPTEANLKALGIEILQEVQNDDNDIDFPEDEETK